MAKMTLEKTMQTSFRDMSGNEGEGTLNAFKDYNRRIRLLGESGRLGIEDVRELIYPDREDQSDKMKDTATNSLSETEKGSRLFEAGLSAVMVAEVGRIIGAYDNPNASPILQSYGPGLMWAMLKVGQERYAATVARSTSIIPEGYEPVNMALTGLDLVDVLYEQRHHIGGSSFPRFLYPGSKSMRALEYEKLFCGVSGILATDVFRYLATEREDPTMRNIANEARESGALGDFDGNLFAGSLDSTMATRMLLDVLEYPAHGPSFTNVAIEDIQRRHALGINVH